MLKEQITFLRRIIIFCDMAVLAGVFLFSYYIRNRIEEIYPLSYYAGLLPMFAVLWVTVLYSLGMYRSFRTRELQDVFFIIYQGTLLSFILFSSFLYVFKVEHVSRGLILMAFLAGWCMLLMNRGLMMLIFYCIRDKGLISKNILLIGTGRRAQNFIKMVESHTEWGLRIIGLIDNKRDLLGTTIGHYKVLGMFKDIPRLIHENIVDEVVFVVPGLWLKKIQGIIHRCEVEGVNVSVAVDVYEPEFSRMKLSTLAYLPIVTFESVPDNMGQLMIKRLFDIFFSAFMLILLLPVFFVIAVAIKRTSPGPVFYNQIRCGLNGRKFVLYKFRTMHVDAEKRLKELLKFNEMEGPAFKIENDPRITPLGGFLRKLSLDEIPQFWNVLRGDMSLVGPRPPIPTEVDQYDDWHRRRLRMRPGITCLWQVNGRNKITDFNDWANLDLQYIDHWSLGLDFKIFLKTIPTVLMGIGAK